MENILIPKGYPGRILRGNYSPALREHLLRSIGHLEDFERLGLAPMVYIAAWQEPEKLIWYEFIGKRLLRLLDCTGNQAASRFRSLVLDQRTYSSQEGDLDVHEDDYPLRPLTSRRGPLARTSITGRADGGDLQDEPGRDHLAQR